MSKSNEELYELLSIIAHDVRNPLASIESYLDPDTQAILNDNDRNEFNTELVSLVRNTSHMLDETLHWSRNKINKTAKISLQPQAIGTWLNSTIDHLKSMAKSKGVLLLDGYDGSNHLNCDPNLMTVVIRNILQNAIKFTDAGRCINFKVEDDTDTFIFSVQDEGVGMSEAQIEGILEGHQNSTLGTNDEKGTGFGLQITREYIDLHGGGNGMWKAALERVAPSMSIYLKIHFLKQSPFSFLRPQWLGLEIP